MTAIAAVILAALGPEGEDHLGTRQHPEGRAETWAWGRWVEIPATALPSYDETLVDEIDEATALRGHHRSGSVR